MYSSGTLYSYGTHVQLLDTVHIEKFNKPIVMCYDDLFRRESSYKFLSNNCPEMYFNYTKFEYVTKRVAQKYGIPKSTISFRNRNPEIKDTFGPAPILTFEEETKLVKWISEMGKRGFPRKIEDLVDSVQKFLKASPRKNPFPDDRPGPGWVRPFFVEMAQFHLEHQKLYRELVHTDIRKWFAELDEYFDEKNLKEVLKDPNRVFNGDETGIQICPNTGRVLAQKGSKNAYCIEKGSSKETCQLLHHLTHGEIWPVKNSPAAARDCTCNPLLASRRLYQLSYRPLKVFSQRIYLPPLIVYPYKRLLKNSKFSSQRVGDRKK
ncbi:hypothetical protein NQ317_015304 [Molorchus minor]|uniref:HTH CENPB-type domain-containing protein n=1 Tax=Molorchus minor TaxID=1323400 RepID=A0ABQ9JS24_9CUCU|nr:hypothetical protein NQ317_015304 [Molorchus minor]